MVSTRSRRLGRDDPGVGTALHLFSAGLVHNRTTRKRPVSTEAEPFEGKQIRVRAKRAKCSPEGSSVEESSPPKKSPRKRTPKATNKTGKNKRNKTSSKVDDTPTEAQADDPEKSKPEKLPSSDHEDFESLLGQVQKALTKPDDGTRVAEKPVEAAVDNAEEGKQDEVTAKPAESLPEVANEGPEKPASSDPEPATKGIVETQNEISTAEPDQPKSPKEPTATNTVEETREGTEKEVDGGTIQTPPLKKIPRFHDFMPSPSISMDSILMPEDESAQDIVHRKEEENMAATAELAKQELGRDLRSSRITQSSDKRKETTPQPGSLDDDYAPTPKKKTAPKHSVKPTRIRYTKRWDPILAVSNSSSILSKVNLLTLLQKDAAWDLLTPVQQRDLLTYLPPAPTQEERDTEAALLASIPEDSSTPLPNIPGDRLRKSSAFRTDVRTFKEELAEGKLDASWIEYASGASERRRKGEFDGWKEREREGLWRMFDDDAA